MGPSAAMLLDTWTNGRFQTGRDRLRALSGDHVGGSTFADVARAYARVGIPFRYSPNGGDRPGRTVGGDLLRARP